MGEREKPARAGTTGVSPSAIALIALRVVAAIIFAAAAAAGLFLFDWPTPLCVVLFAMAVYIALETAILVAWASASNFRAPPQPAGSPYKEMVTVAITTQGVVLGLVAFQAGTLPNATVKVGACSLVTGILVAGALLQNVAFGEPDDGIARFTSSLLFSLTYWSLGFGLLCIVAGSW